MLSPELAVLLNAAKVYIISLCTEQQSTPIVTDHSSSSSPSNAQKPQPAGLRRFSFLSAKIQASTATTVTTSDTSDTCLEQLNRYILSLRSSNTSNTNYQQCTAILVTASWYLRQVRTDRTRFTQCTSLSGLRWKNLLAVWNVEKWSSKSHETVIGNACLPETEKNWGFTLTLCTIYWHTVDEVLVSQWNIHRIIDNEWK